MKTASVAETKSHLSSLIADVEAGNDVLITRRGEAVARLGRGGANRRPHRCPDARGRPAVIYLDTSVVGALFFREPGAARVFDRLEPLRREGLVISAWTLTEMASVGGIKQRTGAIDAATRQQALAHFQRFVSAELRTVEVEPADFRTAAVFIDAPLALRAGDALHLAIAHRLGARLASLDRRLNEAAVFHHIACEDVLG